MLHLRVGTARSKGSTCSNSSRLLVEIWSIVYPNRKTVSVKTFVCRIIQWSLLHCCMLSCRISVILKSQQNHQIQSSWLFQRGTRNSINVCHTGNAATQTGAMSQAERSATVDTAQDSSCMAPKSTCASALSDPAKLLDYVLSGIGHSLAFSLNYLASMSTSVWCMLCKPCAHLLIFRLLATLDCDHTFVAYQSADYIMRKGSELNLNYLF